MPYVQTTWTNGASPALNATNLNKIEAGIAAALRLDGSNAMTGQLITVAGSVGAPAIAPNGDLNNGIYFPATDTIAFTTAGTERVRVASGGLVGIGTASPTEKLQVNATTGNNAININTADAGAVSFLSLSNTGASGKRYSLNVGGNTIGSGLSNNLFLYDNDNAAVRFLINPSGNVGIGTTSPNTTFSWDRAIGISGTNSSAIELMTGATLNSVFATSATQTNLGTISNIPLVLLTNNSEKMRITSAGNVGIGTTSPPNYSGRSSLVVNGVDGGIFECMVGGTTKFQIYPTSTSQPNDIVMNSAGTNGTIIFQSNSSTGMIFNANRYLLIGYASSNGAYPLQVNGQIFATSSTIATSDARYKENVTPLTGALDLVNALNPVQFNWKKHPVHNFNTEVPTVGFLAQEVEAVLADKPYLSSIIKNNEVEYEKDGGLVKEDFLGIAEGSLIAILVKAVKELNSKVESLEAKLANK